MKKINPLFRVTTDGKRVKKTPSAKQKDSFIDDDFVPKKGKSRSYYISNAALSILDLAKSKKLKLDDFINDAIIFHGCSVLPKKELDISILRYKSEKPSTLEKRIEILERIISIIGMKFIEDIDSEKLKEMKHFIGKRNTKLKDMDMDESWRYIAAEADFFNENDELPLWAIAILASNFRYTVKRPTDK